MSKTGGGRGTNQYRIRGIGKTNASESNPSRALPEVKLSLPTSKWDDLLRKYPTGDGAVQAIPEPTWTDQSDIMSGIASTTPDRVSARFRRRLAEALHNDAWLEGIAYTEPEIQELLGGTHVPGHTEGEEFQVIDMQKASDYLLNRVAEGPIEPDQAISDDIHIFIAAHLNISSLQFRGDQRTGYLGPKVRLGGGEDYRALDAHLMHDVLDAGLDRIKQIEHPVVRGATWAAFAAYEQFYFDGNKRTGRYVMNAVAMSHGYDAILVPAAHRTRYRDLIVSTLRSGNLDNHIAYLLSLYPRK